MSASRVANIWLKTSSLRPGSDLTIDMNMYVIVTNGWFTLFSVNMNNLHLFSLENFHLMSFWITFASMTILITYA